MDNVLRITYELDSAIKYRQRTRMFGDIDNTIPTLTAGEIVEHNLGLFFDTDKIKSLFDRDDVFYKQMIWDENENGTQRKTKRTP